MSVTSGDGDGVVQAGRHQGLAVMGPVSCIRVSSSPCNHCSVALHGEAMLRASGNSDDITQAGWYIGLPEIVVAPSRHRAIDPNGEAMVISGSDEPNTTEVLGYQCGACTFVTPSNQITRFGQPYHVVCARSDCGNAG